MMWELLGEHFAGYLFALLSAVSAALFAKIKGWRKEQKILKNAMLALLHDRLYTACCEHITQDFCSVEDKRNLEYMFRPYSAMGGNGICKKLYEECLELPFENSGGERKIEPGNES